jgi:hypothetical protein
LVVACPLTVMPKLASMRRQERGVAFLSQDLRDAKSGPGRAGAEDQSAAYAQCVARRLRACVTPGLSVCLKKCDRQIFK